MAKLFSLYFQNFSFAFSVLTAGATFASQQGNAIFYSKLQ
jgi:hypothetical protein